MLAANGAEWKCLNQLGSKPMPYDHRPGLDPKLKPPRLAWQIMAGQANL